MITHYLPHEIEKRSFEIITQELGDLELDPYQEPILKRVIHTTADFEYVENLVFSEGAVEAGFQAIRENCVFVTDTNMGLSGINKGALKTLECEAYCFMADEDVAKKAKDLGTTRAYQCMEKAAEIEKPLVIVVGNAQTALIQLHEMIKAGRIAPRLIIGVPVGFVNVVESKELIMESGVPFIVAKGRKGGSNVAASIVNALLYQVGERI